MEFGDELRRRRVKAGLSLRDLARLVHYSRGYLSKVETGQAIASIELARLCDSALGSGGALTGIAASAHDRRPAVGGRRKGGPVVSSDPDARRRPVPLVREDLLSAGMPVISIAIPSPARISSSQAESATTAFTALFGQLRQLGQCVFPGALLPTLIAQTETLRGLAASARDPARTILLGLAARYAEYTGWTAQEIGDDHAALWWTDEAVRLADAAGQPEMGAYALVRRALVGMYRGDAAETIDLARMARSDPRASERVRGLAALREAQGYALMADDIACQNALERGREHLARAEDDPATAMLGTSTVADPAAMVTGWCLHDLGRPADAGAVFDREIAQLPATAQKARTRFAARRALAYAAAGEVDHACGLTRELLGDAQELSSATIRLDLVRLARALNRWPTHGSVRSLQPELTRALRPLTRQFAEDWSVRG
ncbi:MAG TPA: helix-turn-helix transcriptional regulator [Streptosporangiaceae bacterium]|nr:helix-turn-helix transcriptional regulator [Streptosporangiaceae bacterium]